MKTIAFAGAFSLCFLFSAITARPIFDITGKNDEGESELVLDVDGKELLTNETYFVRSSTGGGLSLAFGGRSPKDVVQEPLPWQIGFPLKFTPVDNMDVVYESTDLYIKFTPTPFLNSVWGFRFDPWFRGSLLTTGVDEAIFRLVKADGKFYKIVVCSSSCEALGVSYFDIFARRWLSRGGEPLYVQFVKAYP
ncbi:hypothetical protein NMG60_11031989 [Bertholletia excelsa]